MDLKRLFNYTTGDSKEELHLLNNKANFKSIMDYLSIIFFLGSVLNFISQYIIYGQDLKKVLVFSTGLIAIGIMIRKVAVLNISDKYKEIIIQALFIVMVPVITFRFIQYASITVWAFPFVLIFIAQIFVKRKIMISLAASILLTQIAVWMVVPEKNVLVEASDHVVRVGLYAIAILIAFYINKVYVEKLSENRQQIGKIRELAYHDTLTGLPNRLFFNEQLKHSIAIAERMERNLAVMYMDLDGFKMINDTLGHPTGDKLLVEVSKRLVQTLRQSDTVARLGGDEFVIMVENLEEDDSTDIIAQKIIGAFKQPFNLNGQDCFITTSVGVAIYPTDGKEADTIIKNADIAMYKAKENGKNQYVHSSPVLKSKVADTMKLHNQLYRALERNELELYYQPQVCCDTSQIVGIEALIRWNHPEVGMVLPGVFIPIAEQSGLILSIGEWVMRTACSQNKAWQEAGYQKIRVGVNLSVREFHNHDIINQVKGILEETGLEPEFLELEITESIAMKDASNVIEKLKIFKNIGIKIAIDDFGMEYSALNYLRDMPVDRIKIAMPFIQGIDLSDKDKAITKSLIILAKNLGLSVIAEGVESESQHQFLTERMCDETQGFYQYKPMPAVEMEKLLRNNMHAPII